MALVKATLTNNIYNGLYEIFRKQAEKATSGDENENPEDVIKQTASNMAKVISDAVDAYIKSGDVIVGPSNISVISAAPGSPSAVSPLKPAKIS